MERKKVRMPKMELSPEGTARLAQLTVLPHHPSAVGTNIARAKEVLRYRIARRKSKAGSSK
jgi:hypothetical protein